MSFISYLFSFFDAFMVIFSTYRFDLLA